ncbi:MAG: hypothetical protein ABR962_00310 [Candidatus Bathyarchaeia archaeon]|jgi:hypothetical protein
MSSDDAPIIVNEQALTEAYAPRALPATLLANVKRLKYAAPATGLLFLATVAIHIYEIIAAT